ncbi:hypothetical protein BV898_11459 [Hypsibius exemplaris]|uniref:Uncharacterized protein n=1 Tax=Hypsibius exemplaris TaxID=2072580 RepID=A0A1W0WGL2_HYPEX|nr:hypothetical protein BV898_11459 [Hypsibius exemplaris]
MGGAAVTLTSQRGAAGRAWSQPVGGAAVTLTSRGGCGWPSVVPACGRRCNDADVTRGVWLAERGPSLWAALQWR